MAILVLTQPLDVTSDLVITELHRRGVPVHRVDTADFPAQLTVAADIDGHGQWSGTLADPYRRTVLADITHVYFRRPGPFDLPAEMDPLERRWAEQEARLGMTVPPTVITNDPQRAREFAGVHADAGVIYKPLHTHSYIDRDTGQTMALATTPVDAGEITDAVAGTAHLFQRRIAKAYELRVTIAGAKVLAARIDAHSDAARIDWRTDYDSLTYQPVELPARVRDDLLAFTRELRLVFAAIDLIVTPEGEYVFLEVNPGGQWAWIESETDLPITAAIADTLET
ncbi:ATP-dependent carboxylate-amine ligase [Micromonospora fluostatini]|uniref:ATP-dependent carboxylate-amine ligase n=1 Tax=Micromonospora fluostatini TaxID=1629071 RepID=A0ABY2DN88_9ACTN|nr:ATP-dependent carboxylate-amine ligase [Micromonospora fluostatini]